MIFYSLMTNAWSLAASILNGTFDEEYPIVKDDAYYERLQKEIEENGGYEWTPGSPWPPELSDDLDYEIDYYNDSADYMANIDDMYSHYFTTEKPMAHYFKYHEEEILKDIQEYVSGTYQGHYTGKSHEYRNVQTIDLMASKELAAAFCQANILKYGSRYGNKDGKNKKDLMKVIHYAMLLLHFDNHYGEPSMPSGNFEQMP
ncbi:MAG: hypothetical protein CM15mV9_0620 [uncultured marine virus]|nr:MAG: hypothetical protein CM15mV9_0620 [uncultured marine virus]